MKQNKSIKNEIMAKIKKDEIKMTSRWVFAAKKIGLQSGMALSIVVLIFLVNAFFYYLKSNELLLALHYGDAVWQKILHSLPYDLILIIVVLGVILNLIIKKFDFSFKKPFIAIFAGLIISIVFLAALLFSSHFNYYLRAGLQKSHRDIPFLTNFYVHRCCLHNLCQEHELQK